MGTREGLILRCAEDHVFCGGCHQQLVDKTAENKAVRCPTCRDRIGVNPSRARVLMSMLDEKCPPVTREEATSSFSGANKLESSRMTEQSRLPKNAVNVMSSPSSGGEAVRSVIIALLFEKYSNTTPPADGRKWRTFYSQDWEQCSATRSCRVPWSGR